MIIFGNIHYRMYLPCLLARHHLIHHLYMNSYANNRMINHRIDRHVLWGESTCRNVTIDPQGRVSADGCVESASTAIWLGLTASIMFAKNHNLPSGIVWLESLVSVCITESKTVSILANAIISVHLVV